MTHEPFRRTSALNMKLINSCLTVLVFINAVYSAAMRDAFEMNLPLDHTEPTQLSEMDLATEKILDPVYPTDPTAECEAPEIVNSADFSNTTPKPNLVELAVMEDISSQEMDIPEENGRYRPPRTQKLLDKHNSVVTGTDRLNLDFMKEMDPIISRTNLKDQAGKPHDTDKHQQESRKRAMDLDSPEFVDTPDRPDLDADSAERGGGRRTSQTQISGIKSKLSYAANQDILDDSREWAPGMHRNIC